MVATAIRPLTLASAVGAGVTGGVLFGFSTFVMPALRALPANQGIAAMQQINLKAPNPFFMATLFGSAIGSGVIAVNASKHLDEPGGRYALLGSALYLLSVAVTVAYHVPRNNRLAPLDPTLAATAQFWRGYARNWTLWNHVRTLGAIAGSVLLTLGWRNS